MERTHVRCHGIPSGGTDVSRLILLFAIRWLNRLSD
jgi:hypothetical protein